MPDHDRRVALVMGGSSGIGRGAARALARQGAAVGVHGLRPGEADETVGMIRSEGGRAISLAGPIQEAQTSVDAVSATVREFGRLDTLVVSTGIQRYGDAVETTEPEWDEVFAVNVKGAYLAVHHALGELRASGAGAIVLVASVQGTATQRRVAAYTASKGAIIAFARSLAVDEASAGVRVNTVSPGSIDTPMLRASAARFSDGTPEGQDAVIAGWGTAHALARVGTIDEVGEAIAYLCGPRSSFITGVDLRVDGGMLAMLPAPLPTTTKGH